MWVVWLILKIFLYLLALLMFILLTVLVVPFSYRGNAEVYGGITFSYRLGWFWNLFSIRGTKDEAGQTNEFFLGNRRIMAINMREKPEPKEETEETAEEEKSARKVNNFKSMFDMNLIREGLEYLKKILKQISPDYLHLHGTYGFEDPAMTGMTAGFVYTMQGMLPRSKIQLQPCFTDEILELEFKAAGQVSAGMLVLDTAKFLLKKDIRTKIFKRNKKVKLKSK